MTFLDRRNALHGRHFCDTSNDFGYRCPQGQLPYRRGELFVMIGGLVAFLINTVFFAAQVVYFRIDWYDWLLCGSGLMALLASIAFGWLPGWRRTWGDPIWRTLRQAREQLLNRDIPERWRMNILDELPAVTNNPDWDTFDFALAKDKVLSCSYNRPLDALVVSADWLDFQILRLR